MHLRLRDAAAAERLATTVSTPGSGQYGSYLTQAEFDARFAPTPGQAAAVQSFLSSYGIQVSAPTATRRYLEAQGTVAEVSKAFAVRFSTFGYHGQTRLTDDRAVTIPTSLESIVLTVTGLNETGGVEPGLLGRDARIIAPAWPLPSGRISRPCARTTGVRSR